MSLFHFGDAAEHGHRHGSFAEALDPRVKLVLAGEAALWIGLLPEHQAGLLAPACVGMLVVGALSEIAPVTLMFRASAALPFALVPGLLGLATGQLAADKVAVMAGKGFAAAMVATLLVQVTPFGTLLAAASRLGVPDLLVQTTALVYRYLLVLRERAAAMVASARARGYGSRTPNRFAVGGSLLGALLVRSLDRSERVHRAMVARGYTGRFQTAQPMRMGRADWFTGLVLGPILGCWTAASLWWVP